MSPKKTKTRAKPRSAGSSSSDGQLMVAPCAPQGVAPVKPDGHAVAKVGFVARRLGLEGGGMDAMMGGWLGEVEGIGGPGTADRVVRLLGGLLEGQHSGQLVKDCGLTWGTVVLLMDACEPFKKVMLDVYRMRREVVQMEKDARGEVILDTAFELATVGAQQYSMKDGMDLGFKKKSEKMLDRLLVLSGHEFRKDVGLAVQGAAGPAAGGGITLKFHFDGKGGPSITTGETVDV